MSFLNEDGIASAIKKTMTTTNDGGSTTAIDETVASAIAAADIYHNTGTTYLHINNPLTTSSASSNHDANPTGAVVPTISLATTFRQNTPGEPMARDDPNSFGMGYEYSRTGKDDFFHMIFVRVYIVH